MRYPLEAAGRAPRRPSAVSQVLRRIEVDLDGPAERWVLPASPGQAGLSLRIAESEALRRRALELAHRVYRACGYTSDEEAKATESYPGETLTFLVQDEYHRDIATASLAFDGLAGLPCDEIFGAEVRALRSQSRRMAEVTRLALDRSLDRDKSLLVRLFAFLFLAAHRIEGCDDFLIEVNPRHAGFYRRFLRFEACGPERPCPRVNNAPAVLLRLDLHASSRFLDAARRQDAPELTRTLYAAGFGSEEETRALEYLRAAKARREINAVGEGRR